jgi:hypothetical protein
MLTDIYLSSEDSMFWRLMTYWLNSFRRQTLNYKKEAWLLYYAIIA